MMKTSYRTLTGIMTVAAALSAGQAVAYEAGDWIVRVGAATVAPDVDSDPIDVLGLATLEGVDVDNNTQLSFTATYMLSEKLGIELLAATPFSHDIEIEGAPVDAGETKHLPPTLSLQYYFMDKGSDVQPYVGAGINYTIFFEEDVDSELNGALDGIAGAPSGTFDAELELDDSVGIAFQAGVDWKVTDTVMVNAGIWWIDIDTEATVKTFAGKTSFDVELDPWVYNIGVAMKF